MSVACLFVLGVWCPYGHHHSPTPNRCLLRSGGMRYSSRWDDRSDHSAPFRSEVFVPSLLPPTAARSPDVVGAVAFCRTVDKRSEASLNVCDRLAVALATEPTDVGRIAR